MKKSIWLALLAMLFLFANSCHDEVVQESDLTLKSGKLKKDVADEIKSWYDSNPDLNKFALSDYADEIKWESAQVMELDNTIVTEVKVKLKKNYEVISEKDPTLNFDHRLLFIRKGSEITSYMEYFISKKDKGYLQDTEKVCYLNRDGSFDGTIVLEDNKGKSSVIYHSTGSDQDLRLKSAPVICYGLFQIFSDGSRKLLMILYCTGETDTDYSGGTQGSGHADPECHSISPTVDQILKESFLSATQRQLLESALVELIGENCMTSSVVSFLINNNVRLDFKMNSSLSNPASYGPASKSVSFRSDSDINSASLKEELFHAMQDAYYPGGTAQYISTGKVQIEFEAKLYKDIGLGYGCCYIFQDPAIPYEIRNGYTMWVESVRDTRYISNSDYQRWLLYFNQYHSAYSSSTSPNLTSPSVLNSIISQCPN